MSSMHAMPMHHGAAGWAAAAPFLGMWTAMTVAMMLPSMAPVLWRYRRDVAARGAGATRSMLLAGAGYLAVWTLAGVAVLPIAATPARPLVVGAMVLLAGMVQCTSWKAHQLARCSETTDPCGVTHADACAAWRHGLRLGRACVLSCAAPMAALLAIGVMDLRAMGVVTAAITLERLAPAGAPVARATGMAAIAAGLAMLVRAAGAG